MTDCLGGWEEQDVRLLTHPPLPKIRFRRFVNPVQIAVAPLAAVLLFETRPPRRSLPDGEY